MFHAKDGLSFGRQEDGSVLVTYPHAPNDGEVYLDPDTWASVVAAMSAQGETAESWRRARALHMGGEAYA